MGIPVFFKMAEVEALTSELMGCTIEEETMKASEEAEKKAEEEEEEEEEDEAEDGEDEGLAHNHILARNPVDHLTAAEHELLENLFSSMNTSGSGVLRPMELVEIMKSEFGVEIPEEALKRQLELKDEDGLDLDEFKHMMAIQMKKKLTVDDVKMSFNAFDLNQDGYIDKEELGKAMAQIGFHMQPDELDEMIKDADKDGDGKISFNEFAEKMTMFNPDL